MSNIIQSTSWNCFSPRGACIVLGVSCMAAIITIDEQIQYNLDCYFHMQVMISEGFLLF